MRPLNDVKGELGKNFEKLNEGFFSFWRNVQALESNGVARLLSTPPGRILDSTARTIGQSVHSLKSKSETAISTSVSRVVEDFNTLRRNVERNVRALRSGGGGGGEGTIDSQVTSPSSSAAPPMLSFPTSKCDILAGVVCTGVDDQTAPPHSLQQPLSSSSSSSSVPPTDSIPSNSFSPFSSSEEVSEEKPHPDFSIVSATSVFSIGSLGLPLFGPQGSEGVVFSHDEVPKIGDSMAQGESSGPVPLLKVEDVRRSIGKVLIVYNKIRSLGFVKSSWENKMPWRNPRPISLAKGLKWPQQKFSSVRERHEYHRRARRPGRYLIGATPGWSWFAADIVLLYFLINNPAGNFLI